MSKKGKFIGGVILGAALGTIGGILFAPDKGSVTRKDLKKKATDYSKQAKKSWHGLQEQTQQLGQDVKKMGQEVAGDVQERTHTLLEKTGMVESPKSTSDVKTTANKKRFFKRV